MFCNLRFLSSKSTRPVSPSNLKLLMTSLRMLKSTFGLPQTSAISLMELHSCLILCSPLAIAMTESYTWVVKASLESFSLPVQAQLPSLSVTESWHTLALEALSLQRNNFSHPTEKLSFPGWSCGLTRSTQRWIAFPGFCNVDRPMEPVATL